MCSPRNTGNIDFSLWLTGGLSQGCPDFQKVHVFKVYVPFSCPTLVHRFRSVPAEGQQLQLEQTSDATFLLRLCCPASVCNSEKFFASQERVSGVPEKGDDLRGSPGNFWGSLGNFRGSLGNFRGGNPWIVVKFHSERTSGEVAEKLPGKLGELPGKAGDFPEAQGSLTPSQRLAKFVSKQQWKRYFRCGIQ